VEAPARKPYPSDVTDDEWAFVAPYLTLMKEDAPQREHRLREVFNGLRWLARTGAQWRMLPHDLPPWYTVYQQAQRWLAAGCFEALVDYERLPQTLPTCTSSPSSASCSNRPLNLPSVHNSLL
jgi:transposase